MIKILFSGSNCDFDSVLTSTLSVLKRSEYKGPYTFYIYQDTNAKGLDDQMIDYLNEIVMGFHYQSKVVKVESTNPSNFSTKALEIKSLFNNELANIKDTDSQDYEYVISEKQECKIEDILTECNILKEIYQGGMYYAH